MFRVDFIRFAILSFIIIDFKECGCDPKRESAVLNTKEGKSKIAVLWARKWKIFFHFE